MTAPARADAPPPAAEAPPVAEAAPKSASPTAGDPTEAANKRYLFLGFRYRATYVPKFMVNLFVDEGRDAFSHSGGLELDVRRDGFSIIPNLSFSEYWLADTLFLQHQKDPAITPNYSYVNSKLNAIFLGVDLVGSAKMARRLDFEYGLGLGAGFVWGDLIVNWVKADPAGPFTATNGNKYSACQKGDVDVGCNSVDHSTTDAPKVGGHVEPNWLGGGVIPNVYIRVAPFLGLRIKPARDLEIRLQLGWSLTEGPFAGASFNFRMPTRN